MKISHTVEKEDGSVVFQGTLQGPELAFVIEYGINKLMLEGALPFVKKTAETPATVMDVAERVQ